MTITREQLEQYSVSFFKNVKASKLLDMPIGRVLKGIRDEAYQSQVAEARHCLLKGDKVGYAAAKGNLPAVTFCGTFAKGHKAEECLHYNELLVVDIDKLEETEMLKTRKVLAEEPVVAAYWVSPSGHGFKGLVAVSYEDAFESVPLSVRHKTAFRQLFMYMFSTYGIELDRSGSDICRLCYMSSDSELVVKQDSTAFDVKREDDADIQVGKAGRRHRTVTAVCAKDWNGIYGRSTGYKHNAYNRSLLVYILKKLEKKQVSITDTWENWVKVAFAIASSVHPEKGRELFLRLCRLDGVNHDEERSERLIWDAYSRNMGRCSISSIIYLARQKGIVLDGLGCSAKATVC